LLHVTSVRSMPKVVSTVNVTFCGQIGSQKLGQPVPESNFASYWGHIGVRLGIRAFDLAVVFICT
jgi:hypothetical protein